MIRFFGSPVIRIFVGASRNPVSPPVSASSLRAMPWTMIFAPGLDHDLVEPGILAASRRALHLTMKSRSRSSLRGMIGALRIGSSQTSPSTMISAPSRSRARTASSRSRWPPDRSRHLRAAVPRLVRARGRAKRDARSARERRGERLAEQLRGAGQRDERVVFERARRGEHLRANRRAVSRHEKAA